MNMRPFTGDKDLERFLRQDIHVHSDVIASALKGIRDEGDASIFNVVLSDDELTNLELK